jgi:hypothetical protein
MPLSVCSNPVNPCSVEDACVPVGCTTVAGAESCAIDKTPPQPDYSPKAPEIGAPEAGALQENKKSL